MYPQFWCNKCGKYHDSVTICPDEQGKIIFSPMDQIKKDRNDLATKKEIDFFCNPHNFGR
jgi:hypothetical protein